MQLVYLTFISSSLLGKQILIKSNESDWTITWPLGIWGLLISGNPHAEFVVSIHNRIKVCMYVYNI